MIKNILLLLVLCIVLLPYVYSVELPLKIQEGDRSLIAQSSASWSCTPDKLKFITNNAYYDIKNINEFFDLGLSQEELGNYADVIESDVYPKYQDGFCNADEYLTFLFDKLNLTITQEDIDLLLSHIQNLERYELINDNLEEPNIKDLIQSDEIKRMDSFSTLSSLIMDTADYLIGDTFIVIVFVDDPSNSWNSNDRNYALSRVGETAGWMEDNDPSPANVEVIYGYYNADISIDPYDCDDDYNCQCRDWMNEAVANIGFTDSNSNGYLIDEMNNYIMDSYDVDSVYPIFMIHNAGWFGEDSSYSCSGEWIPRIALFFYEFCFIFCNRHEDDVYIHESLHAFSADDEYAGPWTCDGVEDCAREVRWGYPNGNCAYCVGTQDSIMKCCGFDTSYWASYYTRGQIGWGDHDGDNVLDPLDACMYNYGTWCNGCSQPNCGTCKYAYCPSSGAPYCVNSPSSTQCGTDYYEYGCPWGNELDDDTGKRYHDYHCNGAGSCLDYPGDWQIDESCSSNEFCYWDEQGSGDENYYCTNAPCTELYNGESVIEDKILDSTCTYFLPKGISIDKNKTVLDCNNALLLGNHTPNEHGVVIWGNDNVTVKDCRIENYDTGVWVISSTNNNIYGNTFMHNQYGVILFFGDGGNTVKDNIMKSNTSNMWIWSSNNKIFNNNFYDVNLSIQNNTINTYCVNGIGNFYYNDSYGPSCDKDNDSFYDYEDCNDINSSIHPGAPELCNGVDDNCDDEIDEDGVCGVNYSITLYPGGWNIISLPLQPINTSLEYIIKDLSGRIIILEYDTPTTSWKFYHSDYPGLSTLTEMNPSKGYRVLSDYEQDLTITGNEIVSTDIDLYIGGWNYVGYNSLASQDIISAISSLSGRIIILDYDTLTSTWEFYHSDYPGLSTLTEMRPGNGYLISSDINQTWVI